ncbi:MAG: AhpC/TSA family protein [Chloroflexia bacterium]|nr:AhpC/TSA family protein [Chloroflexia bacterium]
MKKILFVLSVVALVFACNQQDTEDQASFTINGTVAAFDSGYVYLQKVVDGDLKSIDSVLSTQGKFNFKGAVGFAEMYYLTFGDKEHVSGIFLDNSIIDVTGHIDSLDNVVIKGSKSHDEYKQYQDEMKPFDNKEKDLYTQYSEARKDGNEDLIKQLEETWEALDADKNTFIKNYIGTNNKSVVTPYILTRSNFFYSSPVAELDSLVSLLDSSLNKSVYYAKLKEKVEVLYSVNIGKTAPDFTLNDTTGNPIAMSSLKGKYLLIDFWASWCGPCRRENPNNVALYKDYKDKGFEILGVSFDNKKENWIKGINDDGLTWPQISDLEGWKCAAGKIYGVSSIPHTVLLDKEGVIIAKDLRGDELRAKIAELLD